MAKSDYRTTMFPKFLVDRIASGMTTLQQFARGIGPMNQPLPPVFGGAPPNIDPTPAQIAAQSPNNTAWMGPGTPLLPMAPRRDVVGRQYDYDVGDNISISPRQSEELSFAELRALAEALDLVKLCIETRKDQMENLQGGVLPKKKSGNDVRAPADPRCQKLEELLQRPDGKNTFNAWKRMLVHEMLVTDAPAVYVRRTIGGDVFALELMDGATIVPKIAIDGRRPNPPDVAYQQVLKGVPAVDYTSDELLYWPRNPRVNRLYGFSPVQQLAMTMNIAIRREVGKLNMFTAGNIPDALCTAPEKWGPDQIATWQKLWDGLLEDVRTRAGRLLFIPGGSGQVQKLRDESLLFGQPDEWFARVLCYCFSLPCLPFVSQQNRATAETANEAALEEGLQPLMSWFKSLMDHIIQIVCGFTDLEWVWADEEETSAEVAEIYLPVQQKGIVSGDEMRAKIGLPAIGLRPLIYGIGPLGAMFVDDFIKYAAADYQLPWQAQQMAAGAPGASGAAPSGAPPQALPRPDGLPPAMSPDALDPMSGVSPELLEAVGLGPQGSASRSVNVTTDDEMQADPLSGSVAHPQVLKTLRAAEAAQRARGLSKRALPPPRRVAGARR